MKDLRLEVLIGMIASGKSTYARKRAADGALVVCHDDLTAMLHTEYRHEQGLRNCYRRMEEELAEAGMDAGRDVVIDRTHLTRESRERWVDFAHGHMMFRPQRIDVIAVTFPIALPQVHAVNRFRADPRGRLYEEWLDVARHHAEQVRAEPLDWQAEGFDGLVEMPPQ